VDPLKPLEILYAQILGGLLCGDHFLPEHFEPVDQLAGGDQQSFHVDHPYGDLP
jgi:hypothetical protein